VAFAAGVVYTSRIVTQLRGFRQFGAIGLISVFCLCRRATRLFGNVRGAP